MKAIVTTTINPIGKALERFIEKKDWKLIVAGDTKTPHSEYENVKEITYLHPELQEQKWKTLSDMLGWKTIQRRNLAFLEAYEMGAEVVATIDDDNIPYENWGDDCVVGEEIEVDVYEPENSVFDPLSVTNNSHLWHRGYPLELIKTKNRVNYLGKSKVKVDVQAGLWDGDPDIDAIQRLTQSPCVKFDHIDPYHSRKLSVFNSQNTFISRRVLPYYMVMPFVGRMDDIWGAYMLQKQVPDTKVVYTRASVYQERNTQNLIKNLRDEIIGYENNLEYVQQEQNMWHKSMPIEMINAYKEYRSLFK